MLLQDETIPKIIIDNNSYNVDRILKENFCIINSQNNELTYIIDLALPQNDENFITQINVIEDIYDISNKDWIVYQSPSNNTKSLGNDIKYYNLCTKELVTYREAGEDYGWVFNYCSDTCIDIFKLDLNTEEKIYYETKRLDYWLDGFEPSTTYLAYEDIEKYISKSIENPTEANIRDYINDMPKYVSNCIVKFKDEYETDKYFVIYIKEKYFRGVDYNKVCLWEKEKSSGGRVIDNDTYEIDGLFHNKYLVIDSGTYITRGKAFYNLDLDITDEDFSDQICTVFSYYMFDNSDWVIYCPVTNGIIVYEDTCDIALYNLKTNEKIIYKEANENCSFTLKKLKNKKVNIVKIERDEDGSPTRTAIETIDLTDFEYFEKNIIN